MLWLPSKRKCSRIRKLSYALLCMIFFLFLFGCSEVKASPPKHILFLYAQTEDYPAHKSLERGFKKQLQNMGEANVEYSYTYLELSRFSFDPQYPERLASFLKLKYAAKKPDLVVTHFGPAADFALKYGRETFPRAQFILAMDEIEGLSASELPQGFGSVAGIFEVKETVMLIKKMQQDVKKIYVVVGDSEQERNTLEYFRKDVEALTEQIEFVYLNTMSFAKMIETVKNVRGNAAIIYIFVFRDVAGNVFVPANEVKTVSTAANVPVYAAYVNFMGRGIIGGNLMSAEVLGMRAAEMGILRLQSQNGPVYPVMVKSTEYQFDWRELKRWKIDESKLPPGSKVLYKELTVWEQYRVYIVSSVLLIVILSVLVVALLINRSRRLRAEKDLVQLNAELENKVLERTISLSKTNAELKDSQERYRALIDQSFEGLALIDIQTLEVMEVNQRFTDMFGYSLPEDAPLYVDKFSPYSPERLHKRYVTLKNQRVFQVATRKFLHKNGSSVFAERAGTYIEIKGKDYLLSSLRDVTTERRRQKELRQDVEFASRVQKELLPELVKSPFVSIHTIYQPSNIVSGDSYFMEWCNDGTLLRGLLIDITGHGLATALQTASINSLLRETARTNLTLIEQLCQLNSRAAKYFSEGSYASMIGFELDFSAMELRYVGAGITQFYINGRKILTPGMFVGMIENAEFGTGVIPISEGDCVHFLTDGFTDRISQPENASFWSPNGKDFDADVATLEQLAEKGALRDDATALCFKINGKNIQ